jgi:hypothetical protein
MICHRIQTVGIAALILAALLSSRETAADEWPRERLV